MRQVIYSLMVSLDGFIEGPNHDLTWAMPDEELHVFVNDQERAIGAHLYGRRTYELMAGFWPTADADPTQPEPIADYARIWRAMPKIVFSKKLDRVEWNARLGGDIATEVARLKAQPGKDVAVAGADLAASFMRLGLIDEYRLFVHPVVLGAGTPMFPPLDERLNLRLIDTRAFGSGVVYLAYQNAG